MIPIILSGGSGTRLWPVSRSKQPKQFCELLEKSTLQELALLRGAKLGNPLIITSQELQTITEIHLKKLNLFNTTVLTEPIAKNTGPAIAFVCDYLAKHEKGDEIVAVFPADSLIENDEEFLKALRVAENEAEKGFIVTLGIKPHFPATGYGYIKMSNNNSFGVERFCEKPDLKTAQSFLLEKNYFWNAGIFVFKVNEMIKLFKILEPDMWKTAHSISKDLSNLSSVYPNFKSLSIDYAILEKLDDQKLKCIPCEIGWSDVGSWDAVAEVSHKAEPDTIAIDSKNNYIHSLIKNSSSKKVYALIECHDLIVVDTQDALLIAKKGSTQKVKDVVDRLKTQNDPTIREHVFEERPWGHFEILRESPQFKSKIIRVNPRSQISYQSHNHREEHWLITKGSGEVILDDQTIPVKSGSYIKIPQGSKHRIRNNNDSEIEFIEVQLGTYFGEDDLVRYQDDYNRK